LAIKILLDTSILITSFKLPLDIFGETERLLGTRVAFLVPKEVMGELQKLSMKQTSLGTLATRALEITNSKCMIIQDRSTAKITADESLIRASKEVKAAVATTDNRLRMRLRAQGLPTITLRGNRLYCEPETLEYWSFMLQTSERT
jgi:rRNA-processing protein FCF1